MIKRKEHYCYQQRNTTTIGLLTSSFQDPKHDYSVVEITTSVH